MEISGGDAHSVQVFGQIFRHAFGQGGHQNAFVLFRPGPALAKQVFNLSLDGADFHFRVQQTRRTDDLFRHNAKGALLFPCARSGRNIDALVQALQKFVESQRAIVQG